MELEFERYRYIGIGWTLVPINKNIKSYGIFNKNLPLTPLLWWFFKINPSLCLKIPNLLLFKKYLNHENQNHKIWLAAHISHLTPHPPPHLIVKISGWIRAFWAEHLLVFHGEKTLFSKKKLWKPGRPPPPPLVWKIP